MSDAGGGNLPKVLSVLELLTQDELVELNRVVVARLRLMQQIRAHGAMMNIRLGQRVHFTNGSGQLVRGVVARHNRKSITVVTDTGHQWRDAPELVEAD